MTRFFHLATSLQGGAGVAARNLHTTMLAMGWDSRILTFSESGEIPMVFQQRRGFLEKFSSKIVTYFQVRFSKYSFFSLISLSSKKLIGFFASEDFYSDILVVHNSYNLVSLGDLVKISRNFKRVIVIQHDMRWITGGCHSPVNCNNFLIDCNTCPLLPKVISGIPHMIFKRETNLIRQIEDRISLVSPSKFLASMTNESTKFAKPQASVGRNQLTEISISMKRSLDSREITLGVATNGKFSLLKGDDVVQELKQRLLQDIRMPGINVLEARTMADSPNRMRLFYSSIDILLVLSRMDNSPNVIHEAHSLGVPVIATKVGGITELLDDRYDWGIEPHTLTAEFVFSGLDHYINRLQGFENLPELISASFLHNLYESQLFVIEKLANE